MAGRRRVQDRAGAVSLMLAEDWRPAAALPRQGAPDTNLELGKVRPPTPTKLGRSWPEGAGPVLSSPRSRVEVTSPDPGLTFRGEGQATLVQG